ncbi:hypothetical protein J7643_08970 [bacterium]|nr:hypothetical protein [bacterium]
MKQHHYVAIASVTATLGATLFLAGCPGNNPSPTPTATPSTGPTATPNLAKEYLFPHKLDGTYTYDWVTITALPGGTETATDSSALVLKTTKLTSTEAVVTATVDNVPYATVSMVVKNNGIELTRQEKPNTNGPIVTTKELYTNDTFTEAGTVVTTATGSMGAVTMKRVGAESVTAATESFNTLKLQSLEATPNATPKFKWVAKGMGYLGVKSTEVSTSSANGGGIATDSTEILLKSYTK